MFLAPSLFVGPLGDKRVIDVSDCHDSRGEGDLRALLAGTHVNLLRVQVIDAPGIARAVPVLVMIERHLCGHVIPERCRALEQARTENSMQAHRLLFIVGEDVGLLEYRVAHGDFPDVVQDRRGAQHVPHLADLPRRNVPPLGPFLVQLHRIGPDPLGMPARLEGVAQLGELYQPQDHLARHARLFDGVGRVLRELRDEQLVLHGERDDLARFVFRVDELQDADDLVFPRLQGHAEYGAGVVACLLVECGVEGKGDLALDMVDVIDEDRLTCPGDISGEGGFVDGHRRAAGDVFVLGLSAKQGIVLHEAEVKKAPGGQIDRAGIRIDELPRFGEHVFQQRVEVLDAEKSFDRSEKLQGVALHRKAFTPPGNAFLV